MADEALQTFMFVTGTSDVGVAKSYLEMAANNVEQAISLFMDNAGQATGGSGEAPDGFEGIPPEVLAEAQGSPEVRAPMQAFDDRIVESGKQASEQQRKDAILKDHKQSAQRMTFGGGGSEEENKTPLFTQRTQE